MHLVYTLLQINTTYIHIHNISFIHRSLSADREAAADSNKATRAHGTTPLHMATLEGQVETVRWLVGAHADLDAWW